MMIMCNDCSIFDSICKSKLKKDAIATKFIITEYGCRYALCERCVRTFPSECVEISKDEYIMQEALS